MIYTIGHEANYQKAIADSPYHGISKVGKTIGPQGEPYSGGYAFQTIEDAERRIVEEGKVGVWAVFGLDADWEQDTEPTAAGWWHYLLRDAAVIVLPKEA